MRACLYDGWGYLTDIGCGLLYAQPLSGLTCGLPKHRTSNVVLRINPKLCPGSYLPPSLPKSHPTSHMPTAHMPKITHLFHRAPSPTHIPESSPNRAPNHAQPMVSRISARATHIPEELTPQSCIKRSPTSCTKLVLPTIVTAVSAGRVAEMIRLMMWRMRLEGA